MQNWSCIVIQLAITRHFFKIRFERYKPINENDMEIIWLLCEESTLTLSIAMCKKCKSIDWCLYRHHWSLLSLLQYCIYRSGIFSCFQYHVIWNQKVHMILICMVKLAWNHPCILMTLYVRTYCLFDNIVYNYVICTMNMYHVICTNMYHLICFFIENITSNLIGYNHVLYFANVYMY